jgi:hypothetical protein
MRSQIVLVGAVVIFLGTNLAGPSAYGQASHADDPFATLRAALAPAADAPAADAPETDAPPQPERSHLELARERIREALDSRLTVDVIELEFGQLIIDLARQSEIHIMLDPAGLQAAGVTTDQLVSINLREVSLRNVLRLVLEPLGLAAIERDEVLLVTSLDCDQRSALVRTYSLQPLRPLMDYPAEIVPALELAWGAEDRGRGDACRPRATIVAGSLMVRGSARHHQITDDLIRDLVSAAPPQYDEPEDEQIHIGPALPLPREAPLPQGIQPQPDTERPLPGRPVLPRIIGPDETLPDETRPERPLRRPPEPADTTPQFERPLRRPPASQGEEPMPRFQRTVPFPPIRVVPAPE